VRPYCRRVDASGEGSGHPLADVVAQVMVQTRPIPGVSFSCLVLGHAANTGPKVWVLDEFGKFHPCLDLMRLGIVGEFGSHRPQHRDELGIGVGVAKGVIEKVVDEVLAFDFRHLGEPVHQSDLLRCGVGLGRGAEHPAT
jgi:hypothetical protein